MLAVCQQRRVVQSRIEACVGQFYRSCTCTVSGKSRARHPFVCIGCLAGGEIHCRSLLLSISRYVSIPYEMIQLSLNTVVALVDSTVVTGMAFLSSSIGISRKLRADCRISSLVMDPGCPLQGMWAFQRLETGKAASDDGTSYFGQHKTDIQLLRWMHCWSNEPGNTWVSVYNKALFPPNGQQGKDSAPRIVRTQILTLVGPSVVQHLFGPIWLKISSYRMSRRI